MTLNLEKIESCLLQSWSLETSRKWTEINPYNGQCSITSLVLNDIFGGKILKTQVNNQWHFYNLINDNRYDFTKKQFEDEPEYKDIESNRDEAFADTTESQYKLLKAKFEKSFLGITHLHNTEKYIWGEHCYGWHFVKTESLSVIRETLPSGTKEQLHFHSKSQQFFYVLSGNATFEIDGIICQVATNSGIHILAGIQHQISNKESSDLEFIVISEPKSHGDRVIIE